MGWAKGQELSKLMVLSYLLTIVQVLFKFELDFIAKEFWPMGAMCHLCVHFEFFDWIL
jgi:hypothetical protein